MIKSKISPIRLALYTFDKIQINQLKKLRLAESNIIKYPLILYTKKNRSGNY